MIILQPAKASIAMILVAFFQDLRILFLHFAYIEEEK
jgi:hypothetical protein